MDPILKQRLVGVIVLTMLAAMFIPMLFDEPRVMSRGTETNIEIPKFPAKEFEVERHSTQTFKQSRVDQKPTTNWKSKYHPKENNKLDVKSQKSSPNNVDKNRVLINKKNEQKKGKQKPAIVSVPKKIPSVNAKQKKAGLETKQQTFSRWYIQAGSFNDKKNATIFMNKLRQRKFTSFVEAARSDHGLYYRVKVGPELNEKRATIMLNKIEKMFGVEAILLSEYKNL